MEYEFPRLDAIRLVNFRSLGDVTIDLTKSPVVSLVGRNEIGKSSVSYGVRLLGSNINSRRHKEYIRSGTDEWSVYAKFSDGTIVQRTKAKTGQSFTVYGPNEKGELVIKYQANKIDDNMVPKEVQKYVGFCLEPETNQLLNVRLYKDLMLFVDTPSSTNYKVMYNALKSESLYDAIKNGTKESNELKAKANEIKSSIVTCQAELRKVRIVDTESLTLVKAQLQSSMQALQNADEARAIYGRLTEIERKVRVAEEIAKLGTIDERLVTVFNKAKQELETEKKLRAETQRFEQVKQLQTIDTRDLEVCESISVRLLELSKLELENKRAALIAKVEPIPEDVLQAVKEFEAVVEVNRQLVEAEKAVKDSILGIETVDPRILTLLEETQGILTELKGTEEVYQTARSRADEYHQKLHDSGAVYGTCPRCGELVIMENSVAEG